MVAAVLQRRIFQRPFDFVVAFAIFCLGIKGVADPAIVFNDWLIDIISLYFIVCSLVVMISLMFDGKKRPLVKFLSEMYGWLFIGSAAFSTFVIYMLYISYTEITVSVICWSLIWLVTAGGAMLRYFDLKSMVRCKK